MSRVKTLQDLFKRYRRPGDMVMAAGSFALALTLLMLLIVSQMAVEWSAEKIAWIFYSLLIVNTWVDQPVSQPAPVIPELEGQAGHAA